MAERPILFNGVNVRRILEGRKTQTRRVVTAHTSVTGGYRFEDLDTSQGWEDGLSSDYRYLKLPHRGGGGFEPGEVVDRVFSRIRPGDLLWVRETWAEVRGGEDYLHRADYPPNYVADWPWKPSIHMPRKASRLTLEVTRVRVERIQAISAEDIRAEGIEKPWPDIWPHRATEVERWRIRWRHSWDEINWSRGYSFDSDPWVWVVEFRRAG